jgi:hypothetical protein
MIKKLTKFFDEKLSMRQNYAKEFPLQMVEYKSTDGYFSNELVAVFVQFDFLPIENIMYGFADGERTRKVWLRGCIQKALDLLTVERLDHQVVSEDDEEHPAENRKYTVKLIDFGATVSVTERFMLRLPQEFTKTPMIVCNMDGLLL